MAESWLYYVPLLLQDGDRVAHTAKFYACDGALNSPEKVLAMIDALTAEFIEGEPEPGTLPVVPLGWTLVTAKQGAGVSLRDNGTTPKKKPFPE